MPTVPPHVKNLQGLKFNRLTALRFTGFRTLGNTRLSTWIFSCECGSTIETVGNYVTKGATRSCGCLLLDDYKIRKGRCLKHGKSGTKIYDIWYSMISRCENRNSRAYKNYGARGIKVCDRWRVSFTNFYQDMGDPPENGTIERLNNDGDYSPGNCVWASRKAQTRNRRITLKVFFDGEVMTLSRFRELTGVSYWVAREYSLKGWCGDKILSYWQARKA